MRRILVGYDGSPASRHALDRACEIARAFDASVTVLTAASDRVRREDGMLTAAADEERAGRLVDEGMEHARAQGVAKVEGLTCVEAPDDALALLSADGYDLLVVGHRGLGPVRELLIGSTAKSVVDRAACSVLVVR